MMSFIQNSGISQTLLPSSVELKHVRLMITHTHTHTWLMLWGFVSVFIAVYNIAKLVLFNQNDYI